jgi:DNA-binding transcriptional LysR family regulator
MLEHRQLIYFAAVAEELNFSRAAERLHMAQPPLSVAIRKLERELGTELLARTTREVRLTDAGVMFLAGAKRVLDELEHTIRATRRAAAGELGRLRLAFSPATRYETLPVLGRAFRASRPDVDLLTEEMWNVNIIPALRSGAVNAALCTCPQRSDEIVSETVRSEPIVALVAEHHPLAGRTELGLAELADDTFMLVERELSPRLHDTLVGACRRAGFEPRLRSGGLQARWELEVMADLDLVSLAPESVSRDLPPGLTTVQLTEPDERIDTALLARSDDASPIIRAFREVARSLFPVPALAVTAS